MQIRTVAAFEKMTASGSGLKLKHCGYGITVVHQPSKLDIGVRPPLPAPNIDFGGVPERPKGADCKSAGVTFDGSNPSPTTISD